jgi:hypothetical protein
MAGSDAAQHSSGDKPQRDRTPAGARPGSRLGEEIFRLCRVAQCRLRRCASARGCCRKSRSGIARPLRTLTIELRWIVRHREKDAQQFTVGDLRRVVDDLDRFGVSGFTGADDFVFGRFGGASRVAGGCTNDSFDVLEDCLNAPETSAGNDRGLLSGSSGARCVRDGRGHGEGWVRPGIAGRGAQQRCKEN